MLPSLSARAPPWKPRATAAFVAVNCGAIPEILGESESYGFARGAHSEARKPEVGFLEAANRETILLDEIDPHSEGVSRDC